MRLGAPFGDNGATFGAAALSTRFTWTRWAIPLVKPDETGLGSLELTAKIETFRSDGLVLARNLGYEDCVRRPAAIEPMAMPPIKPMSSTSAR